MPINKEITSKLIANKKFLTNLVKKCFLSGSFLNLDGLII